MMLSDIQLHFVMIVMNDGDKTRYNPVLEAVVTFTEELAYKQAKEADELLAQGKYLGMSLSIYCQLHLRITRIFLLHLF